MTVSFELYNMSTINSTGMVPLVQTINERMMFGQLGIMLLVTLFVIIFMSINQRKQDAEASWAYSSFIVATLSIPLVIMNIVQVQYALILWIALAISVVLMYKN